MIGKTINALLTGSKDITDLVSTRVYPYVMSEDTPCPSVAYSIDELIPQYNKASWAGDTILFSIASFSKDYSELQDLSFAIRAAFELNRAGFGTQVINNIYLTGQTEGFDIKTDTFFNILSFKTLINSY